MGYIKPRSRYTRGLEMGKNDVPRVLCDIGFSSLVGRKEGGRRGGEGRGGERRVSYKVYHKL